MELTSTDEEEFDAEFSGCEEMEFEGEDMEGGEGLDFLDEMILEGGGVVEEGR